jgi:hypothetical protein
MSSVDRRSITERLMATAAAVPFVAVALTIAVQLIEAESRTTLGAVSEAAREYQR